MDDWETEKIEPEFDHVLRSNKWEGEDDEDEEVMDSWEDINEEKKDVEKPAELPKPKPKPKKTIAAKIEEREKRMREEAELKAKEKDEALTPEERRAEMLRRQKLQEEADLRLAMETFGVTEGVTGIDAMMPNNAEEFKEFGEALSKKITNFNKHADYPEFCADLIKKICLTLPVTTLRDIKVVLDSLYNEKMKMDKEKTKKKGKGKAQLKMDNAGDLCSYGNEYDDFM